MSVRLRAYLKTHKSKLRQIADACCLLSCDRGSVLFWRRCSSVATGRGGTCPPTPVWPGIGIGIAEIHGEKNGGGRGGGGTGSSWPSIMVNNVLTIGLQSQSVSALTAATAYV